MALSQAYQEWEQQTKRQGLQQGLQQGLEQERQAAIGSMIDLRFGAADAEMQAIIPALTNLPTEEYIRLLWQLTREELLQRFSQPQ